MHKFIVELLACVRDEKKEPSMPDSNPPTTSSNPRSTTHQATGELQALRDALRNNYRILPRTCGVWPKIRKVVALAHCETLLLLLMLLHQPHVRSRLGHTGTKLARKRLFPLIDVGGILLKVLGLAGVLRCRI